MSFQIFLIYFIFKMIEYGHFGMVVLDNVHRVGNWDLFDAVILL